MADFENECTHKKLCKTKESYTFCADCGVLALLVSENNIFAMKPTNRLIKVEFGSNMDSYNMMKDRALALTEDQNTKNLKLSNYLPIRKTMIEFLNQLIKKHKFTNETFHLTIHYLDTIFKSYEEFKNISDAKLDLHVVGCFLLAGKYRQIM